jgi:hypothetical protein
MKRVLSRLALALVMMSVTAAVSLAQQQQTKTATTETKSFEVIGVDGNDLVVKFPEGTRELTVPDDFRFTVNGKQLSVHELKAGMKGTATITTRTTVSPVTVTEVKNGTVLQKSGSTLIVRTAQGVKMFTQSDVDKRGIQIMKDGKPAQLSEFHDGDRVSATIVTAMPPHIMTQKEVQATVPTAAATTAGGASSAAAPRASSSTAAQSSTAANRPPSSTSSSSTAASRPANSASSSASSSGSAPAAGTSTAGTLPKTASSWPLLALASLLSLAVGLTLTVTRRLAR